MMGEQFCTDTIKIHRETHRDNIKTPLRHTETPLRHTQTPLRHTACHPFNMNQESSLCHLYRGWTEGKDRGTANTLFI